MYLYPDERNEIIARLEKQVAELQKELRRVHRKTA